MAEQSLSLQSLDNISGGDLLLIHLMDGLGLPSPCRKSFFRVRFAAETNSICQIETTSNSPGRHLLWDEKLELTLDGLIRSGDKSVSGSGTEGCGYNGSLVVSLLEEADLSTPAATSGNATVCATATFPLDNLLQSASGFGSKDRGFRRIEHVLALQLVSNVVSAEDTKGRRVSPPRTAGNRISILTSSTTGTYSY
jgi:hypothetical protein